MLNIIKKSEELKVSEGAKQLRRDEKGAVWQSKHIDEDITYVAVFNFEDVANSKVLEAADCMLETFKGKAIKELWSKDVLTSESATIETEIPAHGAKLFEIS